MLFDSQNSEGQHEKCANEFEDNLDGESNDFEWQGDQPDQGE